LNRVIILNVLDVDTAVLLNILLWNILNADIVIALNIVLLNVSYIWLNGDGVVVLNIISRHVRRWSGFLLCGRLILILHQK
jgi:hypothetical protein